MRHRELVAEKPEGRQAPLVKSRSSLEIAFEEDGTAEGAKGLRLELGRQLSGRVEQLLQPPLALVWVPGDPE